MSEHDVAALRATAHPLRLQILSLLTGASMSAAELARELGTTQANASYHLRVLADSDHVVPDGEVKIRGGVAKRYRHPWEGRPDGKKRPSVDLTHYLRAFAAELNRRWSSHLPRSKKYFCDAEMWVTPETWVEVIGLVEQASLLIHGEAQPPRTEGTVHVNLQMAAFGMKQQQ
jgi:DNA-binding transcriptional ArsR family regulator